MRETRHLIVGGGMTGHAAAAAMRAADPEGSIAILGAEPDRPYARPPLSKGLWLGKAEESVWLPEVAGLELLPGRRAVALDPRAREVRDDRGEVHRYDEAPPRDRRRAAAAPDRRRSGHLPAHALGLPPAPRRARPARGGHRRRVHRLGDRGVARRRRAGR